MCAKTKDVSYRKAYKSDHLGVVDLEEMQEAGQPLIFEITDVWFETGAVVAGTRGDFNIAYFSGGHKPLVLNATNADTIRRMYKFDTHLSSWKFPIFIELFIDSTVKMKGQITSGVRVRPAIPKVTKTLPLLTMEHHKLADIIGRVKAGASMVKVKENYNVSDEMEKYIIEQSKL